MWWFWNLIQLCISLRSYVCMYRYRYCHVRAFVSSLYIDAANDIRLSFVSYNRLLLNNRTYIRSHKNLWLLKKTSGGWPDYHMTVLFRTKEYVYDFTLIGTFLCISQWSYCRHQLTYLIKRNTWKMSSNGWP